MLPLFLSRMRDRSLFLVCARACGRSPLPFLVSYPSIHFYARLSTPSPPFASPLTLVSPVFLFGFWFGLMRRGFFTVGLDAAGKTTILYKLKLGEIVTTIPTIGTYAMSNQCLIH